jgi:hypothetical protein
MIVRQRSIGTDGSPSPVDPGQRRFGLARRGAAGHHAPVVGRILAICGWLAWQVQRPFRGFGPGWLGRAVVVGLALVLVVAAATPIVVPLLDPQPEDVGVQEVFDGAVTEPEGWIRLRGRIVALSESPADRPGPFALLVDADEPLRAIVLETRARASEMAVITGRLVAATVAVEEDLPIEATVAGTPPRIVPDRLLVADPVATPERQVWWPLAILPALLAVLLLVGVRAGYPVFRPTREVDVLSAPMGPGERLPAAYGGRIGPNRCELTDPGGALLLVRRGPQGALLTAQPLADEGRLAPAPVTIGGGWTSGRLGYVYTVSETVPALIVRSELVDATFLFARVAERDRVAGLVSIER